MESRMMGNYHVRFLGDKGGVIRLSYPIRASNKKPRKSGRPFPKKQPKILSK